MTDDVELQNSESGFLFSPSRLAFYRIEDKDVYLKSGTWPDDLIEISEQQFKKYAQSAPPAGKTRGADIDGMPIWVNLPEPTTEEKRTTKSVEIRANRDRLIEQISREINRLEDIGEDASDWREYRQKLRDIPEQDGFPFDVDWPAQPREFTGK